MRNLKRFLAMALTMLMLVTSLSIVTSAKFEDVTDFQNEIAVLAQLGVIKGKADGTFGFDEPVTRRQTALFFARATTGKVDDALHWQSKVNTTPFKDLDPENDYYGAISYCHNNGIVKGRSTTEFAPNDNITFKEAITMAVRALGYKGADMDAGYPWSYYSKAVTLGLDKGIEDVGLDDVVTRGVMAKLIYNMMFATNSEGTTIAAKAFGSAVKTTVLVLVAAKGKTLVKNLDTSVESNSKLAAFVELNDDGTFNYDKVYHFDWATFAELAYGEGNEEKAVDHVGYSYTVVTLDNLKSLVTVSENPVKKLTSADYVGDGKLEGTEYELVQKWSSVFNIDVTKTGKEELIQYNTTKLPDGAKKLGERLVYYGGYYYVVDNDNNILDKDGNVLLYYYEYIVAGIEDGKFSEDAIVSPNNTTFPYYYRVGVKDETAKFYPAILPVGARYEGAATPDQHDVKVTAATYATDKNAAKYTKNVSAYADTIVFDDNNDGVFDRAYFTAYVFGKLKVQDDDTGDGKLDYYFYIGANGGKYTNVRGADKVINLTDVELKKDTTYYVLWAHDAVNETVTVKKVYDEIKSGYVTAVDIVNKTITFGNVSWLGLGVGTTETLKYGVAKLPGATNTNEDYSINDDGTGEISAESLIGVKYSLLYKSVSYIVDEENDGRIVAILDEKSAAGSPLVITGFDQTSWLTFGNIRAYVIDNAGNTQVITISSINGIPATSYKSYPVIGLWEGRLVYGSKQNDGTWLITTNIKNKVNTITKDITLAFYNGVAFEQLKDGKVTDSDIAFKHKDGSLVIVVKKDKGNGEIVYEIAKGVPANGATVDIPKEAEEVYAESGFMYIPNGFVEVEVDDKKEVKEVEFSNGWNVYTAYATGVVNDIIYLKSAEFYGGANYTYQLNPNAYFSIITGEVPKYITTFINSDITLEAGSFYKVAKTVQNNAVYLTVLSEVELDKTVVTKVGDNYVVDKDGNYEFVGEEIVLLDWRDPAKRAPDKKVDKPKADQEYTVLYYAGKDLSITKRFLLVTEIKKVEEKPDYELTVGTTIVPDNNPAVIHVYNPRIIGVGKNKLVANLTFEVTYYDVENGEVLFEGIATGEKIDPAEEGGWCVEISDFKRVVEIADGETLEIPLTSGEYIVKVTMTYKDKESGKTSNPVTVGPVLLNFAEEPGTEE